MVLYVRGLQLCSGGEGVLSQTWLVKEFTCDGSTAPAASSFRGGVDGGQSVRQQLAAERRGGISRTTNASCKKFVSLRHESGMPFSQPSRKMIEPPRVGKALRISAASFTPRPFWRSWPRLSQPGLYPLLQAFSNTARACAPFWPTKGAFVTICAA